MKIDKYLKIMDKSVQNMYARCVYVHIFCNVILLEYLPIIMFWRFDQETVHQIDNGNIKSKCFAEESVC